jgi:hypothetical protein
MAKIQLQSIHRSSPLHAPSDSASGNSSIGIKHPYLGIVGSETNWLLVMDFVGEPLSAKVFDTDFRKCWSQSDDLRTAFLQDVGVSALNLVDSVDLCRNDIRPPNIAVLDDGFCLIDFDMSRAFMGQVEGTETAFLPDRSLFSKLNRKQRMMCSSTAQIILTVFMLSAERAPTLLAVTGAVSIWSKDRDGESAIDAEVQRCAVGRGGPLLAFVSANIKYGFQEAIEMLL